ncbi:MAG: glycosyltransferase [Marinifilaceae bacterium]|nr:glycosyltransferase [Marinifilaceae bacterium]
MRKILVISSKAPYPLYRGGGAIRTYQMIKSLSKCCDIDLLYITDDKDVISINEGVKTFCNNIIPFYKSKKSHYWNVLKGLFVNRLPLQVNYFYFKDIQKWIDVHISDYDGVFCNNIRTTEYVRKKNGIIKWVDFVDAISMNYEKAQQQVRGIWSWLYRIDHIRCSKYEQDVLAAFDKSMVISEVDKKYILDRSSGNRDIQVIGNYVDVSGDKICHQEGNYNVVFVGKMNYEPNITAVKYFACDVFPLIREKVKQVKFFIVGANPPEIVQRLGVQEGVIVTGFVDDVTDYMRMAAVSVAPMRSGAGIQNKILQAMALGGCVVTTSIGAEGLDVKQGGIVVEESSLKMAETIIHLLEHPTERARIGKQAIQYIYNNLVANIVEKQVREFIA